MRVSLLLLLLVGALWSRPAAAQSAQIRAPGTAIPGIGLIGAEAAATVSTAFGVRNPYILAGISAGGLAAGIVGGIFANRIQGPILHDVVGVSTLAIGMGGVLPSTLLVLQIRSNDSTRPKKEKKKKEATAALPPALLQYQEGALQLSAPALAPLSALPGDAPIGATLFSSTF